MSSAQHDRPRFRPVPRQDLILQLTKLAHAGHTSLSFRDGEVEVLRRLGWKLRAFPALHVAGYFLSKGVCYDDDTWQGRGLIEKIPKYVKKYVEFFCNLTLQDYSFQQYPPTQLASAILYASRVALQLEPRWRPELVRLTGYDEHEIIDGFHHVWSYYEDQFPGHGSRSISPRSVSATGTTTSSPVDQPQQHYQFHHHHHTSPTDSGRNHHL